MPKIETFKPLFAITLFLSLIWLRSGIEKLMDPSFPLALPKIISQFSSQNPYPFYKSFLLSINSSSLNQLASIISWGEFLTGLLILTSSITLLLSPPKLNVQVLLIAGLIFGAFLNLNFWLAAGWTSPSTEALNFLMISIELVAVVYLFKILRRS